MADGHKTVLTPPRKKTNGRGHNGAKKKKKMRTPPTGSGVLGVRLPIMYAKFPSSLIVLNIMSNEGLCHTTLFLYVNLKDQCH